MASCWAAQLAPQMQAGGLQQGSWAPATEVSWALWRACSLASLLDEHTPMVCRDRACPLAAETSTLGVHKSSVVFGGVPQRASGLCKAIRTPPPEHRPILLHLAFISSLQWWCFHRCLALRCRLSILPHAKSRRAAWVRGADLCSACSRWAYNTSPKLLHPTKPLGGAPQAFHAPVCSQSFLSKGERQDGSRSDLHEPRGQEELEQPAAPR